MPQQDSFQVDRMRGLMSKVWGAKGAVSLGTLLAVVLTLWQGTMTSSAQSPPPAPDEDELSAAHLSPDGCSELIINGGFEATDLHWGLAGTALPPSYSTAKAYAGDRSMRLGIVDSANQDANDNLYQDITLPDSAQHFTLSFHFWASHEDTPGSDMQLLNIYEATTGVRLAQPWARLSNEQTWQFELIDLTHFRGRTLRIEFGVHNDGGGGRTALYLDEVSLLACEPDATPFVTPPATATVQPTGTPPAATPQPVTTPVPGGCVASDTLTNGDFESVLDGQSNWAVGESPVPPILASQPSGGALSLRLGNPPGSGTQNLQSYSSVRQLVQLPAGASSASLRWNHLSRSQDPATLSPALASDRQELILLTSTLATEAILYRNRAENAAWETMTVDLTPYLDGSYYLYFNVFNDGNGRRTWMFLDDVQLLVCYATATAPGAGEGAASAQPQASPPPAATSSTADESAAAQPGSGPQTPAPDATQDAEASATPALAARGTMIAVGVSTPSSIIQRSRPSAAPAQVTDVTVWQRFLRISQTAQGQTFIFLLLIVFIAVGYLRFRGSGRPPT
ncbi:MAG: hypothetical protein F4047_14255 [Caldilineaceae bacterium SB0670_bin_27]|uniref:MAM domain-containing protein n=1 Tax=Caldilineaceae bacterium SB0664_bin_27 TaxID=2605260 RepID=A0A6B0YSV5_9CHLR|nr:hypothetical protein [Caldilineaceae bacterium SB0664_bin_27]MYJ79273.1 hypothetical protein [Caldilineaceae bacterium SB0670_bin_27]